MEVIFLTFANTTQRIRKKVHSLELLNKKQLLALEEYQKLLDLDESPLKFIKRSKQWQTLKEV